MRAFTGVSGSGKSTLLHQVILPAVEQQPRQSQPVTYQRGKISGISISTKVSPIDQNPIGLHSRSDVATYVDVLTRMSDLFVSLPGAKTKGLQAKHFSYNHRKGMCTTCWGLGYRKVEMHFLPDCARCL